jgi:hypothetical protein
MNGLGVDSNFSSRFWEIFSGGPTEESVTRSPDSNVTVESCSFGFVSLDVVVDNFAFSKAWSCFRRFFFTTWLVDRCKPDQFNL